MSERPARALRWHGWAARYRYASVFEDYQWTIGTSNDIHMTRADLCALDLKYSRASVKPHARPLPGAVELLGGDV